MPFIAAALIGITSAFTTTSKVDPTLVKDINQTFYNYQDVKDLGQCVAHLNENCEYDASQQPLTIGENRIWEFN